jgi:hypothetical protein
MKSQQRGISVLGLLVVGGTLAFLGVIGAQVLPTVIEYQAILKATRKVAAEGGTIPQIRANFDRAQNIDDFKAILGKDLEITKNGDKVVTSFAYNKEIHLGGPAYLLIKYAGSSEK